MEGRIDWGRYDFGTFRRLDVLTMGRLDCKAAWRADGGEGGGERKEGTKEGRQG